MSIEWKKDSSPNFIRGIRKIRGNEKGCTCLENRNIRASSMSWRGIPIKEPKSFFFNDMFKNLQFFDPRQAYHIIIFSLYPILRINHLSSSSPIKILLSILLLVWNIRIMFFEKGQDFWIPIFIIILFNGGLIVLFVFTVSMIPKEKRKGSSKAPLFLSGLLLLMVFNIFREKKSIGEFFYQRWWMVLFGSLFMIIYFLMISVLTIDFFKRIKSL